MTFMYPEKKHAGLHQLIFGVSSHNSWKNRTRCRVHTVHSTSQKPQSLRRADISENSQYVPPCLARIIKVILLPSPLHLYCCVST